MDQDIIIKFCVVGEPGVGKTSMLYRYVHNSFDQKIRPTIGCDFSTKLKCSLDGKHVRLQLWDIAGQQRFNSVSKMYLRGALGCVIVCSSTDATSLEQTIKWKGVIQENAEQGGNSNIPCLLVQNKSDLIDHQSPQMHQTKKHLEQFAKTNGFCGVVQCSAKQNKNVEQLFQTLLDEVNKKGLVKSSTQKATTSKNSNNIVLQNKSAGLSKGEKKKCCS